MGRDQLPHNPPKIITARCSQPLGPRGKHWGKEGGPHCRSPPLPAPTSWGTSLMGHCPPRGCLCPPGWSSSSFSWTWCHPHSGKGLVPAAMVEKSRRKPVPGREGVTRGCAGGPRGNASISPTESTEQPGGLRAIYAIYILIYAFGA